MDRYERVIAKRWNDERIRIKNKIQEQGYIDDYFLNKIDKFIARTSLSTDYKNTLIQRILDNDDFVLSVLMADPKRQNIYEQVLYNFMSNFVNIEKLPSGGPSALFIFQDSITNNTENNHIPKEIKSIDFIIHTETSTLFIVHKYTNENGGAQDNQFNDVITQLKNIGEHTCNKIIFCLDGRYYNPQKINYLQSINPNVKITNIENIRELINSLTKTTITKTIKRNL